MRSIQTAVAGGILPVRIAAIGRVKMRPNRPQGFEGSLICP